MKKKILFYITVIIFFLIVYFLINPVTKTIEIDNVNDLTDLFQKVQKNITVKLAGGDYHLQPIAFTDSTCANCEEPSTANPATYGLKISGKKIKISGPKDRSAIIHTNAGYGLFVLDCIDFYLENITITGGIRDSAAMASDAAIVVKRSSARIHNNLITNNLGDSLMIAKNISGIMGICGRENSYLEITDNEIIRNSWDGIALFRNTKAVVSGNYIDGVDKAGGRTPGGGRGVAIGVTWNAKAEIKNNYIARYWKGIGLFVDAVATVQNNIIEDMNTWGISLWNANRGKPQGLISQNIVFNTGAMGVAVTSTTKKNPGFFKDNIIIQTAQHTAYDSPDYYGTQCAFDLSEVPPDFVIENNLFYYNRRATDDLPDFDVNETEYRQRLQEKQGWIKKLKFIDKSAFGNLDKIHNSRISLDWSGTYSGVLPCADCEGIEMTIELKQNGTYQLTQRYLGKSEDELIENGIFIWSPDGSRIRLINSQRPADFQQYQVGENKLFHLNINGRRIKGELAEMYVLSKRI